MVPRGEVGLIFAQMGLATGAIGADLFGAIMLMVLVTTFVTPPVLGLARAAPWAGAGERGASRPGEGESTIWSPGRTGATRRADLLPAAANRFPTSFQFTTFHHAAM